MKYLVLGLVLAAVSTIHAQTAQVIQIDPGDADHMKVLYDKLQAAQKEYDSYRGLIETKYLQPNCRTAKNGTGDSAWTCGVSSLSYKWAGGFDFTSDFRFIVPSQDDSKKASLLSNFCWSAPIIQPIN